MQDLLVLLSDSQFHSGEELGRSLGVTRAAIWKKLQKLESMGMVLHSVKGKGYRLPEELELLSIGELQALNVCMQTKICFQTESTNSDVRKLIEKGVELPILVAAEYQTNGKGRRGRQWVGGVGKNIMMSIGWHFDQGASVVEGLSLAIGVAVSRVLRNYSVDCVGLKWPNDVLLNGKKICGVLLEMVSDQDNCDVVIGLGLNVSQDSEGMSTVDQPWTDLKSNLGFAPNRNKLLVDLTAEIEKVCLCFERGDGLTPYLTEWMQQDVLKNELVQVISGTVIEMGIARGINASGALLFEQNGVVKALHGGEVSVRRK